MPPPNDITINWRPRWRGLKRPGDGVAASLLEGGFCQIFGWRVGFKASLNCNRAGELDRTAQSMTSTTPQSTSVRGGGGWNGRGMAWRLRFLKGTTATPRRTGVVTVIALASLLTAATATAVVHCHRQTQPSTAVATRHRHSRITSPSRHAI